MSKPRWKARRPAELPAGPPPAPPFDLTDYDRRARAFARIYPLLSTSIPTREILRSYHDDLAEPSEP